MYQLSGAKMTIKGKSIYRQTFVHTETYNHIEIVNESLIYHSFCKT